MRKIPHYRGGLSLAQKRGEARGLAEAHLALADLCEVLGIELTGGRRAQLDGCDLQELAALRQHLKVHRNGLDA